MSGPTRTKRFWDARAREDAFFFVDNRLEYGRPDVDGFFAAGAADLDQLLGLLGVRPEPGSTVLEIGCGLGRLTRPLAALASSVLALDVSAEMLARARALNPALSNVTWIEGDGHTLTGVGDGAVDACVSHVVFQHIPDPQVVLGYVAEMGRVLRPGGWSAFQVSDDPSVHRPARATIGTRIRRRLGRAPDGLDKPEWLGSAVDLGALRSTAERAAMDCERIVGAGTQFCCVLLRRR